MTQERGLLGECLEVRCVRVVAYVDSSHKMCHDCVILGKLLCLGFPIIELESFRLPRAVVKITLVNIEGTES